MVGTGGSTVKATRTPAKAPFECTPMEGRWSDATASSGWSRNRRPGGRPAATSKAPAPGAQNRFVPTSVRRPDTPETSAHVPFRWKESRSASEEFRHESAAEQGV